MKRNITTDFVLQLLGIILIVAGIMVAFLNGQRIIVTQPKLADYMMILGLAVYMVGRQLRIKRRLAEDETEVIDQEKQDEE